MKKKLKSIESQLLSIVNKFMADLEAQYTYGKINLNMSLERDLGIDSLGRVELFYRIEKAFAISFPNDIIANTETLADIVNAIASAHPKRKQVIHQYFPELEEIILDISKAKTLVDVLFRYVHAEPNRPHIYLQDEKGYEHTITYGQLFDSATKIANGLCQRGVIKGDTIAIMLPTSDDFFYTFFGVLLTGAIPVPIYPPFRPDKIEEYAKREAHILNNAQAKLLITFYQAHKLSQILKSFIPSLIDVINTKDLLNATSEIPAVAIAADDSALIQYTSGSTGNPKGVLLSHYNLIQNIRAFGKAVQVKPTDKVVSWLPLYHDMGLIGTWLGSLYYGIPITIMSPLSFLVRPERWLWAMHYHRATLSAAPNFAYEICVNKINDENLKGLDLSSWRLALNGAEAIYPSTLKKFTEKFSPYNFKPEALYPVYGLAEASVALCFPKLGNLPHIDYINREEFEKNNRAIKESSKKSLAFVSCGYAIDNHQIRIVDGKGKETPERIVGELEFKGPSTMQGYYRNPKATAAAKHDEWLKTGDYAYQANGEIFITGRKKDIIIKAGRNLYPEEIEEIVGKLPLIRQGCVVAFGTAVKHSGTEKLVVIAETRETDIKKHRSTIGKIRDSVVSAIGLPPDQVVLVPPKSIPKTSSGKLRRSACKQDYLSGQLTKKTIPVWLQLVKLFFASIYKKLLRFILKILKTCYALYMGLLFAITLPIVWPIVVISPRKIAAKVMHYWPKLIITLSMTPVKITGKKNIAKDKSVIYVANHTSYLDTFLLLAILPYNVKFVGKQELLSAFVVGPIFKKLNHIAVNRFDFQESITDVQKITTRLQQGNSIVFFPEGTFTAQRGLRPFKLGAFKVAVETKTPIVAISISGNRDILAAGHFMPQPGKIKLYISPEINPSNQNWEEVVRLAKLTREDIAAHCGEGKLSL